MQYTSGTTGSPKGVLLTHVNLVNNGRFIAGQLRADGNDQIDTVPLFHCFGSVIGNMVAMVTGAAMVFPSASFDARSTLEAIPRRARDRYLRRSRDVHRRATGSGAVANSTSQPANGRDGGRSLSGGDHETRRERNALHGDGSRLRSDREHADYHDERVWTIRSRRDAQPSAVCCRRRKRASPIRSRAKLFPPASGPLPGARLHGDEGLRRRAGSDRACGGQGRLAAYGRPGSDAYRRVFPP